MANHPDTRDLEGLPLLGNLLLLIVGGNDTTRNSMSGIIYQLDKNPDQRKLLEQKPELIPNAVQEILRMQTPLAHMRRTCTEDTEVFGQTIKKGDKVIVLGHSDDLPELRRRYELAREVIYRGVRME